MNIPRGPSNVRRPDSGKYDSDRRRRDRDRDREKEREARTTMTDFRIVGIEIKSIGWTWGVLGDSGDDPKEEPLASKDEETQSKANHAHAVPDSTKTETESAIEEVSGSPEKKPETSGEIPKEEIDPSVKLERSESSDQPDEKRGEKRKAKTPEGGESDIGRTSLNAERGLFGVEDEGAVSKKRSPAEYILTHGKPNDSTSASASSSRDSNQSRFRIYFESPPELDRVPKALRRNPNKRWRRETSSVAPSRLGEEVNQEPVAIIEPVEESAAGDSEAVVEDAVQTVEEQEKPAVFEQNEEEIPLTSDTVEETGEASEQAEKQEELEDGKGGHDGDTATTEQVNETEVLVPSEVETSEPNVQETSTVQAVLAEADEITIVGNSDGAPAPVAESTEEAADISMVTDPGAVAAAIDQLIDAAEAAVTEANGDPNNSVENLVTPTESQPVDAEATEAPNIPNDVKPEVELETAEAPLSSNATNDGNEIKAAELKEEEREALAASAENAASAYKTRARRRSSVSSVDSRDDTPALDPGISEPSVNRLSILYGESSRRLCLDAAVVEKVKIHRKEGKIDVTLLSSIKSEEHSGEGDETPPSPSLPTGILVSPS